MIPSLSLTSRLFTTVLSSQPGAALIQTWGLKQEKEPVLLTFLNDRVCEVAWNEAGQTVSVRVVTNEEPFV